MVPVEDAWPDRGDIPAGLRFQQINVFIGGEDGFHTYRKPCLVALGETVLALGEARAPDRPNTATAIVQRRSADSGRTWTPLTVLAGSQEYCYRDPGIVVDERSARILMFCSRVPHTASRDTFPDGEGWRDQRVFALTSRDTGKTWSEPRDLTERLKDSQWSWCCVGPGAGIRVSGGRLIVPSYHVARDGRVYRSHVTYSDDGGNTWYIGGTVGNRSSGAWQLIERHDGTLLANMRSCVSRDHHRLVSWSPDAGVTWTPSAADKSLADPHCHAGLINMSGNRTLFSNPASRSGRRRMTIRLSCDGGESWPISALIHSGFSAYSSLAVLPNGLLGCLYERGNYGAAHRQEYAKITLARFSLEWLSGDCPGERIG